VVVAVIADVLVVIAKKKSVVQRAILAVNN
jgi:hypothetical protein